MTAYINENLPNYECQLNSMRQRARRRIEGQKIEEMKQIETNRAEEWKVEKILNKKKYEKL